VRLENGCVVIDRATYARLRRELPDAPAAWRALPDGTITPPPSTEDAIAAAAQHARGQGHPDVADALERGEAEWSDGPPAWLHLPVVLEP
jgi:hypothetical protein